LTNNEITNAGMKSSGVGDGDANASQKF